MGFARAHRAHGVDRVVGVEKQTVVPPAGELVAKVVAAECRAAALDFMAGVAKGWDKIDLALWLTGPYSRATRHLPRGRRAAALAEGPPSGVDTCALEDLLTSARGRTLALLENAALAGGSLDFAEDAIAYGMARPIEGDEGTTVWVPADLGRMRLRDRLCSLFSADFLNGPRAYADLHVCHRCEAVVFDPRAREFGFCSNHVRISGYMRKDPRAGR